MYKDVIKLFAKNENKYINIYTYIYVTGHWYNG